MKLNTVFCDNCLNILPDIPTASVDAVITDPPYPEIDRDYGKWTEGEWWEMVVDGVIPQVRRILKPTGSAMFILQPNSRKVGNMRGWLWKFMYWVTEEWNMVQDVWWWNPSAMPTVHATIHGLMRGSIKACVWAGNSDCYRNQEEIMWDASEASKTEKRISRARVKSPSGHNITRRSMNRRAKNDGIVTPYNFIPLSNTDGQSSSGAYGHGAGTPFGLVDWWIRYIVPPGGVVLDPFGGNGTTALAALKNDRRFIMIEKEPHYAEIAQQRIKQRIRG
jgi:DNA modification methylase